MTSEWKPLSVRESGDSTAYDGPFEGVPDWLFGPLWDWFKPLYPLHVLVLTTYLPRAEARDDLRRIGLALGLALENLGGFTDADEMQSRLRGEFIANRQLFLDAIDYWLAHDGKGQERRKAELDALLKQGRSAWTVQVGVPALVRRVAPEVQTLAADLMREGRAGEHLARAWQATYGRAGMPSLGYGESIKAVEAAGKPVVSPNNDRTTLGTIIRDMQAKPANWAVSLKHHTPEGQVPEVVGMLDLLWTGQTGRHGDPTPGQALDVSQADAEAGLHLALTLCHWFSAGVVRRVAD